MTFSTGTLDHVIPYWDNGLSAEWNLVTACWSCNSAKGSRTLDALGWHLLPCGMSKGQAEAFGITLPLHPRRYARTHRKKEFPKRRAA